MRCPRCAHQEDKVIDSRSSRDGVEIRRRRECLKCKHRFTTYEQIVQAELKVLKRDGKSEDFSPEKIRRGVEKACWKRNNITSDAIDELVRRVVGDLESAYDREVPAAEVGNCIMRHLRELDKVAYIRFASVYREFRDVDEFFDEIRSLKPEEQPGPGTE